MFINLACLSGYFGMNCCSRCTYPYYGLGCQNTCYCNVADCNYVTGCQGNRLQKETTTGWYIINLIIWSENDQWLSTILREYYTCFNCEYLNICFFFIKTYIKSHTFYVTCVDMYSYSLVKRLIRGYLCSVRY